MLVLGRGLEQSIMIADGAIIITVLDIQGDKVKLGIDAPSFIDVHREEIFNKIQSDKYSSEVNLVHSPRSGKTEEIREKKISFSIDSVLLEQAQQGKAEAQFEVGKILFRQQRYGFAKELLMRARENGCIEASYYLSKLPL